MLKSSKILTAAPADAIYLDVPFREKDEAKGLGARWDPLAKKWYASTYNIENLSRWAPSSIQAGPVTPPKASPQSLKDPTGPPPEMVLSTCPKCGGTGKGGYRDTPCYECDGMGKKSTKDFLLLDIPPSDYDKLKFYGVKKDPYTGYWFIPDTPTYTNDLKSYEKWLSESAKEKLRTRAEEKQKAVDLYNKQTLENEEKRRAIVDEKQTQRVKEDQSYHISLEEAEKEGLTVGTAMSAYLNDRGSRLPQYHPGNDKVPPHKHHMVSLGSSLRGEHHNTCTICGATESWDSSD